MRLLIAERPGSRHDRILAGSIFFELGHTATYAFNASRRIDANLRSNEVILWHAITEAYSRHATLFDLGEVPPGNEPLAHFKRKWGAEPVQLYRYYYPAPHRMDDGRISQTGTVKRLLGSVWQRTPLCVTAVIGDYMYGYL